MRTLLKGDVFYTPNLRFAMASGAKVPIPTRGCASGTMQPAVRLLRLDSTLFLPVNRAYRFIYRFIRPIAGLRDFVSHFGDCTKIEISLFYFPISVARSLYRQFAVIREGLDKRDGVRGKCGATIDRRLPNL